MAPPPPPPPSSSPSPSPSASASPSVSPSTDILPSSLPPSTSSPPPSFPTSVPPPPAPTPPAAPPPRVAPPAPRTARRKARFVPRATAAPAPASIPVVARAAPAPHRLSAHPPSEGEVDQNSQNNENRATPARMDVDRTENPPHSREERACLSSGGDPMEGVVVAPRRERGGGDNDHLVAEGHGNSDGGGRSNLDAGVSSGSVPRRQRSRTWKGGLDTSGTRTGASLHWMRAREMGRACTFRSSGQSDSCTVRSGRKGTSTGPTSVPVEVVAWAERVVVRELNRGTYLEMDRQAELVRSTISIGFSCDGAYFASTHGDHTVKVFRYPEGEQVQCLEGHPRTPWTVRWHPTDPAIVATGCLGNEVRIWNVEQGICIRKCTFGSSISCVSFSPDGSLVAVTSGNGLMLWPWAETSRSDNSSGDGAGADRRDYAVRLGRDASDSNAGRGGSRRRTGGFANGRSVASGGTTGSPAPAAGIPRQLLIGTHPFYCCEFHPSGRMIMCGEKNKVTTPPPSSDAGRSSTNPSVPDEQFTLRVVVHRFNRRVGVDFDEPVLVVPRVVAYNDAGIHFSPCGTMLAACIPADPPRPDCAFRIAVLSLVDRGIGRGVGSVLYESELDAGRTIALTNLKFSPSSTHLLAGYSFREQNPVLRDRATLHTASATGSPRGRHSRRLPFDVSGRPRGQVSENNDPDTDANADLGMDVVSCEAGGPPQISVVDVYALCKNGRHGGSLVIQRRLTADVDVRPMNQAAAQDEINVAVFAPSVVGNADGIVYGTQKGRVRMFRQYCGEGLVRRRSAQESAAETTHPRAAPRRRLLGDLPAMTVAPHDRDIGGNTPSGNSASRSTQERGRDVPGFSGL